jgi:hypothetical protein
MRWSAAAVLCCGRDESEFRRRAAAVWREPEVLRESGVTGTVGECVQSIGRYGDAGAERMYLQVLDLDDLDHVELIAAEVAPQLD